LIGTNAGQGGGSNQRFFVRKGAMKRLLQRIRMWFAVRRHGLVLSARQYEPLKRASEDKSENPSVPQAAFIIGG
jgi:hypothetical protein